MTRYFIIVFLCIGVFTSFIPCASADQAGGDGHTPMMFHADPWHSGVNDDGGTRPAEVLKWLFTTGDRVYSSPAVVDGVVYIGSDDENVYALDAGTGGEIWSFTTGDRVLASPAVVNDVVYVGSYDKNLYALDKETGMELWNFTTGGWVTSSPVVTGGVVYSGSLDDRLYAINAITGEEIWNATFGEYPSVDSSPAVADGVLYVTGGYNTFYALDASTGAIMWNFTRESPIYGSPSIAGSIVYVGCGDNNMYALNASTGEMVWNYTTAGTVDSCPAIINNIVYFGSGDHKIYALDALTGEKIWDYTTDGAVFSSPTVANGVVYVGSWDYSLYALDALTGEKIWAYPTGSVVYTSPAVANGLVYFGSFDGNVYAVGSGPDGDIWVSSTPAGAQIYLDGNDTDRTTDYLVKAVSAGQHSVVLKLAGYIDYNETVTVTAGQTTYVNGTLNTLSPVADFTANQTFGVIPMPVLFTDSSTGLQPLAYQWDFGDGTPNETVQSPVHTYTTEGTYTVTLTVSNSGGSSTLVKSGYIFAMEDIITGGGKGYYLIHSNVEGADVYFNGDWYEGTIENGTLLVETCLSCTPVWTFTVKKCGYFSLTQDNNQYPGQDEVIDLYANLTSPKEPLIADFTANTTTGPLPLTVGFAQQSIGIPQTWNWSYGDGTYSEEENPVHTYTADGVYTVSLRQTNSACQDNTMVKKNFITAGMVPKPTFLADFTVSPTFGISPMTVRCIDESAGNPSMIVYDFGDGGRAMGPDATHTYRLPGEYTITQTITKYNTTTNSIMSSVATKPDVISVIKAIPLPPFARFTASPVTGPAPLTVTFTDETFGNPIRYNYDFGDGVNSTSQNPVHTYRYPGVYNVTLTVLDYYAGTGSVRSDTYEQTGLIVVS